MKLWLIVRAGKNDENDGLVIAARTEEVAREIARDESRDEGRDVWNTALIKCIGVALPEIQEGSVLVSFFSA